MQPGFITASKTDLEYIKYPVNLMPRHQRRSRIGTKRKKERKLARTKWKDILCVGGKLFVESSLICLVGGK